MVGDFDQPASPSTSRIAFPGRNESGLANSPDIARTHSHARSRIAPLLCELAVRLRWTGAVEDPVEFPLTQGQLANATGLTAVHTNRVIQSLRRHGFIHLSNGLLRVLDWDQLCSTGDFDELLFAPAQVSDRPCAPV